MLSLLAAAIVIVGGGLYLKHHHSVSNNKTVVATVVTKNSGSVKNANKYTDWTSYKLKYEGLNFIYPPDWHLADTSANGNDTFTFTGSNGFSASIQTIRGTCPSLNVGPVIYSLPLTLAGQATYLDFSAISQNSNLVNQVYVSTSKANPGECPIAKNIKGVLVAHAGYPASTSGKQVKDIVQDQNYLNAKDILGSMRY